CDQIRNRSARLSNPLAMFVISGSSKLITCINPAPNFPTADNEVSKTETPVLFNLSKKFCAIGELSINRWNEAEACSMTLETPLNIGSSLDSAEFAPFTAFVIVVNTDAMFASTIPFQVDLIPSMACVNFCDSFVAWKVSELYIANTEATRPPIATRSVPAMPYAG